MNLTWLTIALATAFTAADDDLKVLAVNGETPPSAACRRRT